MRLRNQIILISIPITLTAALVALAATRAYPIVILNASYISAREFDAAFAIAKKIDLKASNKQVLDQMIKVRQQQALLGLKLDSSDYLDQELLFQQKGKDQEYNQILNDYFSGDKQKFIEYVTKPQAYDALLRVKFNSNKIANVGAYARVQDILNQLNQGQTFEELAKSSSEDKISGQLGGDLGFVSAGQILPELWQAVQTSKLGEVNKQIVISRLGYHILYPVKTATKDGEKLIDLKHILIKTQGYEPWLTEQLKIIFVWKIVNI